MAVCRNAFDAWGRGYPRPLLQRDAWYSLNGEWDFAIDPESTWQHPSQVKWNGRIRVPFAPEAASSGVGRTDFFVACWYRLSVDPPDVQADERLILHFGAVDYGATVWINGEYAGAHVGGYTPFSFDITEFLNGAAVEISLRAKDDPHDLAKPRGKQDWQLAPHSIWYARTTGIWQTVWMEKVPATRIGRLCFTPNLARWEIGAEVWVEGGPHSKLHLRVKLRSGDLLLANDTYEIVHGEVHRGIALSDPGIDDSRNDLLWCPQSPNLLDVSLELWADGSHLLDRVQSYTALRTAAAQGDRFHLNGRPQQLRMVLDQGYWPDSGLTAPSDDALRADVQLALDMGFNGVRKHQKIEDPRYLYWADRLGLLVWEEMPSAYRFTAKSVTRLLGEWAAVVHRDASHPCIVAWVPINESWGVPNLPEIPRERHYVQALYHLTKTLDPTRPVIGNDGWESVATDIIGIHDYDDQPSRIARRYEAHEVLPQLFKRERPGGRLLVLEGQHMDLPVMLNGIRRHRTRAAHNKRWHTLGLFRRVER